MRYIIFIIMFASLLSACTVDENGIRDPVSEAKADATRQQTATQADAATYELETKRMAQKAQADALKVEADARAYETRVMAEARADSEKIRLAKQAETAALVTTAFGYALSAVLVLGAACAAFWIAGLSYSRARNAVLASEYVKIGVEPSTLLPPPIVITADGFLVDTRTGERARLRDAASVDRLRLASTTQQSNIAMLARSAERIAADRHPQAAQVADQIGVIAPSVQMIDVGEEG